MQQQKMIQVPAFSLLQPLGGLSPNLTAVGGYSSTIAQQQQLQQQHGGSNAMDLSGGSEGQLMAMQQLPPPAIGSGDATMMSSHMSPSTSQRSLTAGVLPQQRSSAFSPIGATSLSSTSTMPVMMSPEEMIHQQQHAQQQHMMMMTNAHSHTSTSGSIFAGSSVSPSVSPSLFKRMLLNTETGPSQPMIGAPSMVDRPQQSPSLQQQQQAAPAGSPVGSELMKVLANVACTVNNSSAALPPAHPIKSDSASPKLSFLGHGGMIISPTHARGGNGQVQQQQMQQPQQQQPTLPSSSLSPSTSLASISSLKAQHAMEIQSLLQAQQQQLAELEMRAMKELHQSNNQHAAHYAQQQSQMTSLQQQQPIQVQQRPPSAVPQVASIQQQQQPQQQAASPPVNSDKMESESTVEPAQA